MTPHLQGVLCERYPRILTDQNDPTLHSSCSLDCGDGWFQLIADLCDCVQTLVDHRETVQHVAQHVKEKFGGLRVYWHFSDDRVDAMTEFAEALSHRVCEQCGAPGLRNTTGWLTTLCAKSRGEARTQQHADRGQAKGDDPIPTSRWEALLALYPGIFSDSVDGTPQPRCTIACGGGWYTLIDRLCACVQSLADHPHLPQPRAMQVKEELGGLRFCWDGICDERVAAMTRYAERLSLHVCEVCGEPGAQLREDWVRTRCELHRDTRA